MSLVSCPHCRVACKTTEVACPHCGETLRDAHGAVALTAAAAILGLTMTACGGPKEPVPAPAYGVAPPDTTNTVPQQPEPAPTESAPMPQPTDDPEVPPAGSSVPQPEPEAVPAYGVPMPAEPPK